MAAGMRLALLISGGGTTMREVIRACKDGRIPGATPALVIASRPDAGGLAKAEAEGIPREDILTLEPKRFAKEQLFGEAIIDECKKHGVNFIGQFGWLPKTPRVVIERYDGHMLNQHPGPLDPGRPDFGGQGMYGRRVHCARLYFVRATNCAFWTEVVSQRVATEFDRGAVILAKRVPILPDDDPQTLQERALPVEHETQIEALRLSALGQATELQREDPLITESDVPILNDAKRIARFLYPKG